MVLLILEIMNLDYMVIYIEIGKEVPQIKLALQEDILV